MFTITGSAVVPQNKATPPDPNRFGVVVVHSTAELQAHREAWLDLALQALEPNAFQEPFFLLPALSAFADGNTLFALVYAPLTAQRRVSLLTGFFPLTTARLHRLLPVRVLAPWEHLYGFLGTPLVHREFALETLNTFLDWLATDPLGAALWKLQLVSADGPFARALTELCYQRHRPTYLAEAYVRAFIEPGTGDAESYYAALMPRRRFKEFQRKERVLGERGRLERRVLAPGVTQDLDRWIEDFLILEAAGWKGKEGTALVATPSHATFFREMAHNAAAEGKLLMLGLYLDDRPVALKFNLLAPPGSFAFKIAFDESYASYSPGVLLELANIDHLFQTRLVQWMDSCAVANHFMINRLWTGRRLIQTFYLATGRAPGDLLVSLFPLGRWLKRCIRRPAARLPASPKE